jgi:hypothetical protein
MPPRSRGMGGFVLKKNAVAV